MNAPQLAPRRVDAALFSTPEDRIKDLETRVIEVELRLYSMDASLQRVIADARRAKFAISRE